MPVSPKVLAETPAAPAALPADALSDVLRVVRLSGVILFRCDMTAPWAIAASQSAPLARALLPGAKQLMPFHLVSEGRCWIALAGERRELHAGDVVVLPYGDAHTMASDLSLKPTQIAGLLGSAKQEGALRVCVAGGGGERVALVCGFVHCDELLFNPLCKGLPTLLHVRGEGAPAIAHLAATVRHSLGEAGASQPGNACLLSRLSELLFIEVLRRHIAGLPSGAVGWLAALNDPIVGRALQLMHQSPAHGWTVDSLARQCATSRSLLAARFKVLLGQPPMQYLACWRLQLAAEMLREGVQGMAAVAARAGYESESAFNRAFKRYAGEPPATWRARTLAMTGGRDK
jgi:AraC family transcriptional regulator, alkane utilization regulator